MCPYYGVLLVAIATLLASSEALSPTVESDTVQSQLVSSDSVHLIAGAGKRFLRADSGIQGSWAHIGDRWLSKQDAEDLYLSKWFDERKKIETCCR
ncbi:hypothetical protein PI124_g16428 [Phytophthora idaei]|nr:hypothetical protein PI125_g16752 [Phytophthora idaei]KAG3141180.1 hypothetical protein PI126_g15622 [Phytophthora idaei]KAG3238624.1 hypothetical protein PI124_g16428 [Phytophthora idaei]